jgi:hypothetical protein
MTKEEKTGERLTLALIATIGEDGLALLADKYGGTRLYVPAKMYFEHGIVHAIGARKAQALSDRFGPDSIKVPLVRELRAARLRTEGFSNAQSRCASD